MAIRSGYCSVDSGKVNDSAISILAMTSSYQQPSSTICAELPWFRLGELQRSGELATEALTGCVSTRLMRAGGNRFAQYCQAVVEV